MTESFEHILPEKTLSWWKRRSTIEKCLIISIIILFLVLIVVLVLKFKDSKYGSYDICFTPKCVKTASQVLEKADLDVNPCTDFYKFACGNFVRNTFISRDKAEINQYSLISDQIEEEMRILLEKPINPETEIKPFVLVKSFYQSCMNISAIESDSMEKFKNILNKIGGWPILQSTNWNESEFDWILTTYKLWKTGISFNMLIKFDILADVANSSRSALYLDQIDVNNKDIIRQGFDEPLVQALYNFMVKIGTAFGGYKPSVVQEMREVIDFYIELVRITVPDAERRNASLENNPMSFRQLQDTFPYVPWLEYFNTILAPYSTKSMDDIIYVKLPQYYQALGDLLQNTSKRTIANYIFWNVVNDFSSYLNSEIRDYELELQTVIYGVSNRMIRWKECIQEVQNNFIVASGALYVRNYFEMETKEMIGEMADGIEEQFRQTLETAKWMDNATRQHALDKMKNMNRFLAFPDELFDDQKLVDYYKPLEIDTSSFLQSVLNVYKFGFHLTFSQLDKKIENRDWKENSYTFLTNAMYNRPQNEIKVMAGILQGVFFNKNYPKYMNYGAIGYVIGHEITHGFDDLGRQFDKNGNLHDWWTLETKEIFTKKAQCFVNHTNSFTEPLVNLTLNGKNTQGELIADVGGWKHSYLAYKKWAKSNGPEKLLPGLSYTPEQLFWISAANVYCSVDKIESLRYKIHNYKHLPDHYRVNIAFRHLQFFANDFNCAKGTFMNPNLEKCEIW